ncbi:GNAT family N-acetyltransferase [Corynebacterium sp. YIM 101645]|uniref:GNAT family N-acetyltransferase n=1 Tax=Corynebacterium lemuris TaxID=1859292 RepID=A0ABT2FW20_9CORY|nr:GNAT family protein [Corynebacterium lemuris]MCS5479169.1 GNAT family N-acetyltransferase [Corynebacterium lemuris]
MRFLPVDRPVPGTEPADAVRNLVFLANLAAQETTGDTASSTSVERVQHRLRGSVEYDTLAFALELDPEDDYAGYLLVSTPLLEDTHVVEAEVILDAGYLPLPGHPLSPESHEVLDLLYAEAEAIAARLGRSTVQTWLLHPATEAPGDGDWAGLLRGRGYELGLTEIQGVVSVEVPAPDWPPTLRIDVVRNLAFPTPLLDGVLALYRQASLDVPTGGLDAGEVDWTPQRLAAAARRVVNTGREMVSVVLSDADGVIGVSEITRFPGSEPEVAEQGLTVIAPRARGRGLGLAIKREVLRQAAAALPGVKRVYTSNATANTWMIGINRQLGWRVVSGGSGWQLRL